MRYELLQRRGASPAALEQLDARSDNRGPEPEGLAAIHGIPGVFVGCERTDAVVWLDFADATSPTAGSVIDLQGIEPPGESPEGLTAFTIEDQHFLAIASEASGTVHVFRVKLADRPEKKNPLRASAEGGNTWR